MGDKDTGDREGAEPGEIEGSARVGVLIYVWIVKI